MTLAFLNHWFMCIVHVQQQGLKRNLLNNLSSMIMGKIEYYYYGIRKSV